VVRPGLAGGIIWTWSPGACSASRRASSHAPHRRRDRLDDRRRGRSRHQSWHGLTFQGGHPGRSLVPPGHGPALVAAVRHLACFTGSRKPDGTGARQARLPDRADRGRRCMVFPGARHENDAQKTMGVIKLALMRTRRCTRAPNRAVLGHPGNCALAISIRDVPGATWRGDSAPWARGWGRSGVAAGHGGQFSSAAVHPAVQQLPALLAVHHAPRHRVDSSEPGSAKKGAGGPAGTWPGRNGPPPWVFTLPSAALVGAGGLRARPTPSAGKRPGHRRPDHPGATPG